MFSHNWAKHRGRLTTVNTRFPQPHGLTPREPTQCRASVAWGAAPCGPAGRLGLPLDAAHRGLHQLGADRVAGDVQRAQRWQLAIIDGLGQSEYARLVDLIVVDVQPLQRGRRAWG